MHYLETHSSVPRTLRNAGILKAWNTGSVADAKKATESINVMSRALFPLADAFLVFVYIQYYVTLPLDPSTRFVAVVNETGGDRRIRVLVKLLDCVLAVQVVLEHDALAGLPDSIWSTSMLPYGSAVYGDSALFWAPSAALMSSSAFW
jgi:hypothetical protein